MKLRQHYRLSSLAARAFMRNAAMQYRATISADCCLDLRDKVRFGADFLRTAIEARKEHSRLLAGGKQ